MPHRGSALRPWPRRRNPQQPLPEHQPRPPDAGCIVAHIPEIARQTPRPTAPRSRPGCARSLVRHLIHSTRQRAIQRKHRIPITAPVIGGQSCSLVLPDHSIAADIQHIRKAQRAKMPKVMTVTKASKDHAQPVIGPTTDIDMRPCKRIAARDPIRSKMCGEKTHKGLRLRLHPAPGQKGPAARAGTNRVRQVEGVKAIVGVLHARSRFDHKAQHRIVLVVIVKGANRPLWHAARIHSAQYLSAAVVRCGGRFVQPGRHQHLRAVCGQSRTVGDQLRHGHIRCGPQKVRQPVRPLQLARLNEG
mmetsp:Transcript_23351/g.40711  ORF Transcript_23351/g.40711 Transcript_23351/m.40711 type:complete len:303 (-) Transcript_23351:1595-2503(-)